MRGRRRTTAGLVAALLALGSAACGSGTPVGGTLGVGGVTACTSRVTPDCSAYRYESDGPGRMVVSAPRSGAVNNREFFWSGDAPDTADQTVCATFASGEGFDQQGVVLRLNDTAVGGVTGITVTRNVWMEAFDVFNFHSWDTGSHSPDPFTMFGSAIVAGLPVRPAVYPLHLCARTTSRTDQVQFVVWTDGQARPAWGSPGSGGSARLPAGTAPTGRSGWFAGHLRPGTSMRYQDLSVDGRLARELP
jgi:hypothetical protein